MGGDNENCDRGRELPGLNPRAAAADRELAEGLSLFLDFRSEVDRLLAPNLNTLVNEPSWGLLHTMYKRALAHVEGCFVLFSHNYCSSAEALCRTAVEASINLYYCSLGNTEERIVSYLKQYVLAEREQNRLWLNTVNAGKYSAAAKAYHRERIAGKEEALRKYERFLTQACGQFSYDYEKMKVSWPSLFDRFQSIGKEVDYRTVYAALCSQAHNDAEDLLNEFVAGTVQIEGMIEQHKRENIGFAASFDHLVGAEQD